MSNAPHESAPPVDTDDTDDTDDADRGNLDGTTASNSPREESLDDAKAQAQGNGSFDDAAGADGADAAQAASDAGGSGQDNGSMS